MRTCTRAKRSLGKRLRIEPLEDRLLLAVWAGYEITASTGQVFGVWGRWTVPTAASSPRNAYASQWVGIDGYNTSTVEQVGTLVHVDGNGTAHYSAWWEMVPDNGAGATTITSMTIHPGDHMTAHVFWSTEGSHANTFQLYIADSTTGQSFTAYKAAKSGTKRSTAEWIVERPDVGTTTPPYPNFGSVTFTQCFADIASYTGPIDHWSYRRLQPSNTAVSSLQRYSSTTDWFVVSYTTATSSAAVAASTSLAAETAVSENTAMTTLDDGLSTAVITADTVSTGRVLSYAWDKGLATFKLTDLAKDDNANLLAKKAHDATATDSVFASLAVDNALDINVL